MKDFVKRCGRMARMFSVGNSVEGRPLWALEIANNPGKVEAKPNARLVGNMHGDEPASRSVAPGRCCINMYTWPNCVQVLQGSFRMDKLFKSSN